jgi:hypothetical protein
MSRIENDPSNALPATHPSIRRCSLTSSCGHARPSAMRTNACKVHPRTVHIRARGAPDAFTSLCATCAMFGPTYCQRAALVLAAAVLRVAAIGQDRCVSFNESADLFPIVSGGAATQILLGDDEWPGVQAAAANFAQDIARVTGVTPAFANASTPANASATALVGRSKEGNVTSAIIVGTLGKSSLIDAIVNNTQLDVSGIEGQWEAFMSLVVKDPLPGIDEAYVVIGADKRGTIFALYDHSEQFGAYSWVCFFPIR